MLRLAARTMRCLPRGAAAALALCTAIALGGCAGPMSIGGDLPELQSAGANLPAEVAPPADTPESLPTLPADPTLATTAPPAPLPETLQSSAPITSPPTSLEELAFITQQITGSQASAPVEAASPSDRPVAPSPAELPDYVQITPAVAQIASDRAQAAPLPPTVAFASQLDPLDPLTLPVPPDVLPLTSAPESVPAARSLEQLIEIALMNHPALAAGTARMRSAQGQYVQAGLRPNPQVSYVAEEINSGGTTGLQGLGVSRTWMTGGKIDYARQAADGTRFLASQQMEIIRGRVLGDVRLAYYDALAAQERVALAEQLVDMSEDAEQNVRQLLNAGFAGQADVLRAQVEVQSNRVRLTEALARRQAAYRQIAAVTGQPHLDMVHLTGDLEQGPGDPGRYTWERLLGKLQQESPEISAAVARIDRARREIRQAQSQATPNINTQVTLLFDDETDDWVTGAGISLPLMVNNRNQGNIMAAQAQLREAEAELARIELNLQQRLAQAYADYSAAQQEAERYARDVLPLASRSRETIFSGFEQGEQSYLDYLSAQQTDFNSRLAYLDALQRQRKAEALLDSMLLSGGLLDQSQ